MQNIYIFNDSKPGYFTYIGTARTTATDKYKKNENKFFDHKNHAF